MALKLLGREQPTALTTGIPKGTVLKAAPNNFKLEAGKTYTNMLFTGQKTFILTSGTSPRFVNCKFDGRGDDRTLRMDKNQIPIIFDRCEIMNGDYELVYGRSYQVINSYLHGCNADGFKPQYNCLIQGNYLCDIGRGEFSHADGVQILGNTKIKVIGNFFDQVRDKKCNRNLMASQDGIKDIEWVGNWHSGRGNFALQLWDSQDPKTIKITDNLFYRYTKDLKMYKPFNVMSGIVKEQNIWDDGSEIK